MHTSTHGFEQSYACGQCMQHVKSKHTCRHPAFVGLYVMHMCMHSLDHTCIIHVRECMSTYMPRNLGNMHSLHAWCICKALCMYMLVEVPRNLNNMQQCMYAYECNAQGNAWSTCFPTFACIIANEWSGIIHTSNSKKPETDGGIGGKRMPKNSRMFCGIDFPHWLYFEYECTKCILD
jgi:hypothetical protein